MPAILDSLPSIYRQFLPKSLATDIPDETKATCSNCAMCAKSEDAVSSGALEDTFFEPSTKCCTYHPSLPNYLVGAILLDKSPEKSRGRELVLEKIKNRISSTPYGVAAPAQYNLLYGNTREFFGRSSTMLCPYYVSEAGGLCSIWQYREAVCSTYFCKHVAGADGRRFWMSLKSYLALVENQLSRYAIYKLYPEYLTEQKHLADPPARKLERSEIESGALSDKTYQNVWTNWVGMETEFFEESYRLIQSLSPKDIEQIMGLDGSISQSTLEKNLNAMTSSKLPEKLRMNPNLTVRWLPSGEVVLGAYSELDALAVPTAAYQMIPEFRGDETVPAVRAKLRREKQSDFSDEVLLELYQHRILEEA